MYNCFLDLYKDAYLTLEPNIKIFSILYHCQCMSMCVLICFEGINFTLTFLTFVFI